MTRTCRSGSCAGRARTSWSRSKNSPAAGSLTGHRRARVRVSRAQEARKVRSPNHALHPHGRSRTPSGLDGSCFVADYEERGSDSLSLFLETNHDGPPTDWLSQSMDSDILCLLRERPMPPHELHRLVRERRKNVFLDLKHYSMYHAIARMETEGFIEPITKKPKNRQAKYIRYRLTLSGRR